MEDLEIQLVLASVVREPWNAGICSIGQELNDFRVLELFMELFLGLEYP